MFRSGCSLLLAVLFGFGCSKSTTQGQTADTSAPCYRACLIMVAADCASYPLASTNACASGCYAEHSTFQQCRAESDSFYSCVSEAGTLSCATLQTEAGALSVPDTSACSRALCLRDRCYKLAQDPSAEPSSCGVEMDGDKADGGRADGGRAEDATADAGTPKLEAGNDASADPSAERLGDARAERANAGDLGIE